MPDIYSDSIYSRLQIKLPCEKCFLPFKYSAKCHRKPSLQFRAIPFQSWCIFKDTVYK